MPQGSSAVRSTNGLYLIYLLQVYTIKLLECVIKPCQKFWQFILLLLEEMHDMVCHICWHFIYDSRRSISTVSLWVLWRLFLYFMLYSVPHIKLPIVLISIKYQYNLREKDHWGDPEVDGRIILKWIFRKWEGVVGTGWSWLRIGAGGGHLLVRWGTFGFQKCGVFLD